MNGTGWKMIFAAILVAGVGAAWVANAKLASLETGLGSLGEQMRSFDGRLLYLERQRRPTASSAVR